MGQEGPRRDAPGEGDVPVTRPLRRIWLAIRPLYWRFLDWLDRDEPDSGKAF